MGDLMHTHTHSLSHDVKCGISHEIGRVSGSLQYRRRKEAD